MKLCNFKKMQKNLISVFTVAVLTLSNFCLIASANENTAFSDVPVDNPYISKLVEAGIIKGYDNGLFGYADNCTRAQFVTFLHRAAGLPEAKKNAAFSDIKEGAYYEDALNWAVENFIVTGFEDGTFGIDKPMDKSHAITFLHRFAKNEDLGEHGKRASLYPFSDESEIELYAREAYAWAIADEIINTKGTDKLEPKATADRNFCSFITWNLLNEHHHKENEWIDNNDGTHSIRCDVDASCNKTEEHDWNDGDLVKKPTEKEDGEILYTCHGCLATKNEIVSAGTEILTRADLEKAVVDTAWYYYAKGPNIQYDSTVFSPIAAYKGGNSRLTNNLPPEFGTDDMAQFLVCSAFTDSAYLEALNLHPIAVMGPAGVATTYQWRLADNQQYEAYEETGVINQPTTEEDKDMAIMRWVDFDKYEELYPTRIEEDIAFGVFSSSSFTDFTDEKIRFVNDGFDGTVHYAYYDAEGNKLDPDSVVKQQIIKSFMEDYEKNLRPGDILVPKGHAALYLGDNRILHCNGSKINVTTGIDSVENYEEGEVGAIYDMGDAYASIEKYTDAQYTLIRPLDGIIDKGYDADLGNDVAKLEIPEKTKSRMKYPCMEINRVVDVSPYGTVAKNSALTYTIEISNKTNHSKYAKLVGKEGEADYNDLIITETIPENTEFVADSIVGDGKIENGTITWKAEKIKPGETITLSYKVKATGEIGTKIVNDGGFVDKIPSNAITNVIGNEKLTKEQTDGLSKISANGIDALKEFGSDSEFAENIYKKAGKELELPEITDITKALFPAEEFIAGKAYSEYYASDFNPIKMFIPQKDVADEFEAVKSMLINDYWGGYRFFIGQERRWELGYSTIKDFKTNYLEKGDILVYLTAKDRENATMSNEFSTVTVMVYDGEKLLSSTKTDNGIEYNIYNKDEVQQAMLNALMDDKDLFFALRPSQAK